MKLSSKLLLSLALISTSAINAQNLTTSEVAKTANGYTTIYAVDENNSFGIVNKPYGRFEVVHYKGIIKDADISCETKIGKQNAMLVETIILNGKLTMFFSVADKYNRKLFARTYDDNYNPVDNMKPLAEYVGTTDASGLHNFKVIQSKNKEYVAIEYDGVDAAGKSVVGVNIYDEGLGLVSKAENATRYIPNQFEIIARNLSNKGEYYQAMNVYDITGEGKDLYRNSLTETLLIKYNSDAVLLGLNEMEFDLSNKMIADMEINSDLKNGVICSGIYGVKADAGVYYFQIDFDNKKIVKETYYNLPKGTINELWVDMGIHQFQPYTKLERSFETVDVFALNDGNIYFVLEQRENGLSSNGSTVEHDFYFNSVFTYAINGNGEVSWYTSLNKYQHTVNEREPLGGVFIYHTDKEMVMFFNDDIRNYGSNNEYAKVDGMSTAIWTNGDNVIGRAAINLENGELKRNRLVINGDPKQDKVFCLPDSFKFSPEKNEVVMYFTQKAGESFGTLKF